MKVLFYFTTEISPNFGGTERATFAVASQLKKLGFECCFVALNNNGHEVSHCFKQLFLPVAETLVCDQNISYMRELIRTEKVDVIVNQDSFGEGVDFCTRLYFPETACITVIHFNLFGNAIHVGELIKESYILGRSSRLKYEIQRILVPVYRKKAINTRTEMFRSIYDKSDYVVLLSESDFRSYPVQDKSRLRVITNPLTLPAPENTMHKEKIVLSVGRQVFSQKKTDLLLRAWKIIEQRHPDWKLDILGDGSCLNYFKQFAKKLKLSNVTFHGNQSPEIFYEKASIMCMTSSYEGFGLVLTEGMQAGAVPVAFKSFEAITEIIDNGSDGMLVKPFNIQEYADAVCYLMEHEDVRREMAQRAIAKTQKFSVDKIGQQWADFLNSIKQ